jgi:hypothetical protein
MVDDTHLVIEISVGIQIIEPNPPRSFDNELYLLPVFAYLTESFSLIVSRLN